MRTEVELRRLMSARAAADEIGEQAVRAAIARLKEHGYLDDRAFAETYARLRQENEKHGARRVRQDLQKKGIHSELIAETIEARYGGASDERLANEEKLAREYLDRKRIRKPANEKETARVMRRLIAAGFSTGRSTRFCGSGMWRKKSWRRWSRWTRIAKLGGTKSEAFPP